MFIPGKIPYIKKASLCVSCSAGMMIDQHRWTTDSEYTAEQYQFPYKDIHIQIELDQTVLYSGPAEKNIDIEHLFEDSESITDHTFKITVSGFKEEHQTYIQDIGNISPMIKINGIWIEQLSMRMVLEDHGQCFYEDNPNGQIPSEYIGQNGFQALTFSTPIYPWLLAMHKTPEYFY